MSAVALHILLTRVAMRKTTQGDSTWLLQDKFVHSATFEWRVAMVMASAMVIAKCRAMA